jgi:hypothetical protein
VARPLAPARRAWIIGAGVLTLVTSVAINIGAERRLWEISPWLLNLNFKFIILSMPLAVSIYLARKRARIWT